MRTPYHCPYCDQISMRKWNLSIHIKRIHPGEFDPLSMSKNTVLMDSSSIMPLQTQTNSFKNSVAPFDWSDPIKLIERGANYRNLLEQIKNLNKNELISLMFAIFQLPQFNQHDYRT